MTNLELKHVTKVIDNGLQEKKTLLDDINLNIHPGDFVTVLGGNGAGKSTLFNVVSGNLLPSKGQIFIEENEITELNEEKRATWISRVFQDPKMGTAPRMTVAENLLLAMYRGKKRTLAIRPLEKNRDYFYKLCQQIGNGLEDHLDTPTGQLSGGQRQALSLLMATILPPKLLLLDEHTAALDPKTSKKLMEITAERVTKQELTCLMITHRMEDALKYGNRLIVLQKGRIIHDLPQVEKVRLTMKDLLEFFEESESIE